MRPRLLTLVIASMLVLGACGRKGEEQTPASTNVSRHQGEAANQELGITVERMPDALDVAVNSGRDLFIVPHEENDPAKLSVEDLTGTDLDAAVRQHRLELELQAAPEYIAAEPVETALGPGIWSRERYDEDGVMTEEGCLFVRHPGRDRTLALRYRYPAKDDPAKRLEQLKELAARIKAE
jgi:hypothetical protein